ncbi:MULTISPECIES: hypothetical protein [unclassified Sphingomonas]|uniref:hypothetical protein n=1 Tax=unclassified Sphingomonas TaxID=196159 RepID=UPI00226AEB35|nr:MULTISPECIES: hypothetical protein [unclassified Sphingomonas]
MTNDLDLLAFGPSDWGERQLARLIDRECIASHKTLGGVFTPDQLLANQASTSEVMMSDGMMIPAYMQPVCTAGQVSSILARPRPTITGWINRYEALGIPQVAQGSTRMFTCADIGKLTALRLAISAGNMADALFSGLDLIEPEIASEFEDLFAQAQLDEWGASGSLRPRLPMFDAKQLRLVNRGPAGLVAEGFFPTRARPDSAYIADLAGFQLPETVLPLGQALRNAWTRMLHLLNGFSLDEEGRDG